MSGSAGLELSHSLAGQASVRFQSRLVAVSAGERNPSGEQKMAGGEKSWAYPCGERPLVNGRSEPVKHTRRHLNAPPPLPPGVGRRLSLAGGGVRAELAYLVLDVIAFHLRERWRDGVSYAQAWAWVSRSEKVTCSRTQLYRVLALGARAGVVEVRRAGTDGGSAVTYWMPCVVAHNLGRAEWDRRAARRREQVAAAAAASRERSRWQPSPPDRPAVEAPAEAPGPEILQSAKSGPREDAFKAFCEAIRGKVAKPSSLLDLESSPKAPAPRPEPGVGVVENLSAEGRGPELRQPPAIVITGLPPRKNCPWGGLLKGPPTVTQGAPPPAPRPRPPAAPAPQLPAPSARPAGHTAPPRPAASAPRPPAPISLPKGSQRTQRLLRASLAREALGIGRTVILPLAKLEELRLTGEQFAHALHRTAAIAPRQQEKAKLGLTLLTQACELLVESGRSNLPQWAVDRGLFAQRTHRRLTFAAESLPRVQE